MGMYEHDRLGMFHGRLLLLGGLGLPTPVNPGRIFKGARHRAWRAPRAVWRVHLGDLGVVRSDLDGLPRNS